MPDINELRDKYFLGPEEGNPPSEPLPATYPGSRITPLIDGRRYCDELILELATIGQGTAEENARDFLLVAGWWTVLAGPDGFLLDGPGGTTRLADVLKEKARAGVDVRVLSLVNPGVMQAHARFKIEGLPFREQFLNNIEAIQELRGEPALAKKCCLNVIGHTVGGAHTKLVVLGNDSRAVGFTGGIDFENRRYDNDTHMLRDIGWHDVVAKVEGPAVQAMYDFFRDMWNELVTRQVSPHDRIVKLDADVWDWTYTYVYTAVPVTAPLDWRTLSTAIVGRHHVQVLQTYHAANNKRGSVLPRTRALAVAPNGLFTFKLALRKAVRAAETYIYMEDWGFWSEEVLGWVRYNLRMRPALRVILVTGKEDPEEVQLTPYMNDALYATLVSGLTSQELGRIRVFMRDNSHVHAKTVIVDDHWMSIGSACVTRRSLYTDIENAVAAIDEDDALAGAYRRSLWGGHFEPVGTIVSGVAEALDVWDRDPGTAPVTRSPHVQPLPLPTQRILGAADRSTYDLVNDPDSRQPCGITLTDLYKLL